MENPRGGVLGNLEGGIGAFLGAVMGDWPGKVSGEIPGTSPREFPGKREEVIESSVGSRVKLGGKAWVVGAKSWLGLAHSWRHPGESALVIPGRSWGDCCKTFDGMSMNASGHS